MVSATAADTSSTADSTDSAMLMTTVKATAPLSICARLPSSRSPVASQAHPLATRPIHTRRAPRKIWAEG